MFRRIYWTWKSPRESRVSLSQSVIPCRIRSITTRTREETRALRTSRPFCLCGYKYQLPRVSHFPHFRGFSSLFPLDSLSSSISSPRFRGFHFFYIFVFVSSFFVLQTSKNLNPNLVSIRRSDRKQKNPRTMNPQQQQQQQRLRQQALMQHQSLYNHPLLAAAPQVKTLTLALEFLRSLLLFGNY